MNDPKKRRKTLDTVADYFLISNARQGCLVPATLVMLLVAIALGLCASLVHAQAEPFDAEYPQAAYILAEPIHADYQLLAAPSGRWSIKTMDCEAIPEYTQVLLMAPLTDVDSAIQLDDGTQCALDPAVRILRQPLPCATRDGVCDVTREPRPQRWELP